MIQHSWRWWWHFNITPGLCQLSLVWCYRLFSEETTACTGQCCQASKEIEEIWPHHTCPHRPALAASQVAYHFQSPLHCPFSHAQWRVAIIYTGTSHSLSTSESSSVCHWWHASICTIYSPVPCSWWQCFQRLWPSAVGQSPSFTQGNPVTNNF